MVTVKVRAIFHLKEMLGAKEITLDLRKNAAIKDLIHLLIEKYGKKLEDTLKKPDGSLNPIITILVNGRANRLHQWNRNQANRRRCSIFYSSGGRRLKL